jgi:hypothetical protein
MFCIYRMNRKELRVSAGSSLPMCGEIYKVEPIPHKLYNSTTRHYDIALLEVCIDPMHRYIHLYNALYVISLLR